MVETPEMTVGTPEIMVGTRLEDGRIFERMVGTSERMQIWSVVPAERMVGTPEIMVETCLEEGRIPERMVGTPERMVEISEIMVEPVGRVIISLF